MAVERIGRAVLELVTDSAGFQADLQQIKREASKGLPDAFKVARGSLDSVAAGMTTAGREASSSAKMIGGMSASGKKDLGVLLEATTSTAGGFLSFKGVLDKIGPAIAGAFTVGAVVGFAKEIGSFAGKMTDLSDETRISTTRLQAFNFQATGVGLTIDEITTSAGQLSKRLGGDDKSVNAALDKLNLNAERLKLLGLDEVMFEIDRALVGVGNQFERANILNDLFGRSGQRMGRMMTGALEDVIKKTEESSAIIDEKLIAKADAFDDAWAQGWIRFRAFAVEAIGAAASALQGLIDMADRGLVSGAFGQEGRRPPASPPRIGGTTPAIKIDASGLPQLRIENGRVVFGAADLSDTVFGGGVPDVDAAARAAREFAEETNKAADATRLWSIRMSALEADAKGREFYLSSGSSATKALQQMMMNPAAKGGVLPNLNAGLTAGLMFGPGAVTQGNGLGPAVANGWQVLEHTFADGFRNLEQMSVGSFGNIVYSVGQIIQAAQAGGMAGQRMKAGFQAGGMAGAADMVLGGLEAFSAMDAATATGSRAKRVAGGAATGAKIGTAIMPGIGTAIGAGVGAIVGVFRGKSDGEELNDTRDALVAAAGGLEAFRKKAEEAGVSVDKLLSARRIKVFDEELKKLNEGFNALTADQERLTAAVERYGFTFEELGPKFQKQRLDESAKELMEDWRVLVSSGIDLEVVNSRMSESINEYLQTAIRVGQEVPKAMRPILEKMATQGLLTDEAGNAITDLEASGIQFSESMTEGFDRVVQKLDELITKLGMAGEALGGLPTDVDLGIAGHSRSSGVLEEVPMMASGGIAVRPLLAGIGERGPEAVIPLGRLDSLLRNDVVERHLAEVSSTLVALRRDWRTLPNQLLAAALARG